MLLMGPLTVNLPIFVPDELHRGDKFIGLLFGSMGLGIVLGSTVRELPVQPPRRAGAALDRVRRRPHCALLDEPVRLGGDAGHGADGVMGPAIFINFVVALIQENTDPRMMGRVMSVYGLSFTSSLPIGYGQAALTSTLFGPRVSLTISGCRPCDRCGLFQPDARGAAAELRLRGRTVRGRAEPATKPSARAARKSRYERHRWPARRR